MPGMWRLNERWFNDGALEKDARDRSGNIL